jgi:hypothetical protein
MVFNATFNNISVLLVEKTRGPGENHRPVAVTDKLDHIMLYRVHHQVRDNISFKYQYSITFYFKATSQQVHTLFVFK